MTRNMKIILGIGGALTLLCICAIAASSVLVNKAGAIFGQAFATDPTEVNAIAGEIAGYRLPSGYQEAFGVRLLGTAMVAYERPGTAGYIILMQYPNSAGLDKEQMEQQMRQALQRQGGPWYANLQEIGQRQVRIRGQQVTLTISEGGNSEAQTYRQATTVFQGKNGPVLLMIAEPAGSWNGRTIDTFLASIY